MLKPPAPLVLPGFFRAIAGFVLGLVIAVVVTGLIRNNFLGSPMYLIGWDFLNDIPLLGDKGVFWDDQATLMFGLFGGALGYLWGAGAIYGHVPTKLPQRAIVPRIPVDPDAPRERRNPLAPLVEALPGLGMVFLVLVIAAIVLGLLPLADFLPKQHQVTAETADTSAYGEGDFNLLGIVTISGQQEVKFAVFAAIVIAAVLGTALFIAGIFYLLNLQVKSAVEAPPDPEAGANFPPIRYGLMLARFFTQWLLDVLHTVQAAVRPR